MNKRIHTFETEVPPRITTLIGARFLEMNLQYYDVSKFSSMVTILEFL